jgi:hypothetical protein
VVAEDVKHPDDFLGGGFGVGRRVHFGSWSGAAHSYCLCRH